MTKLFHCDRCQKDVPSRNGLHEIGTQMVCFKCARPERIQQAQESMARIAARQEVK